MMDDDKTGRLGLPLLYPGQAQKELTHNEALVLLDIVCGGGVEAAGLAKPPVAPAIGDAWIVGAVPIGAWEGHGGALAGWTAGGWRFVMPRAGLELWSRADGVEMRFDGAEWRAGEVSGTRVAIGGVQVVGGRRPGIADPVGGGTMDEAARSAISAVLSAMRAHGLIAA